MITEVGQIKDYEELVTFIINECKSDNEVAEAFKRPEFEHLANPDLLSVFLIQALLQQGRLLKGEQEADKLVRLFVDNALVVAEVLGQELPEELSQVLEDTSPNQAQANS